MMKFYKGNVYVQDNQVGMYSGEKYTRIEAMIERNWTSPIDEVNHVVQEHIEPMKIYVNGDLLGVDLVTIPETVVTSHIDYRKRMTKVFITYHGTRVSGVAKCHEDDEFNSSIGFQIAYSRALMEIEKIKINNVLKLVKERY